MSVHSESWCGWPVLGSRFCARRSRNLFLLVAILTVGDSSNSQLTATQSAKPGEYEVKAAYLYNFGKFVEWPSLARGATTTAFEICVVGQDPFGPVLSTTLSDEKIGGRSVVVKRVQSAQAATSCRILFISSSEEHQLKQVLSALEGSNVLTVSDIPQFSRRGGMVQFILDGTRVRFEINLASAERAGLTLSSDLLKLAVNVRRTSALGD